jgi:hypothetical protein
VNCLINCRCILRQDKEREREREREKDKRENHTKYYYVHRFLFVIKLKYNIIDFTTSTQAPCMGVGEEVQGKSVE